jgi:hypothetical protein
MLPMDVSLRNIRVDVSGLNLNYLQIYWHSS